MAGSRTSPPPRRRHSVRPSRGPPLPKPRRPRTRADQPRRSTAVLSPPPAGPGWAACPRGLRIGWSRPDRARGAGNFDRRGVPLVRRLLHHPPDDLAQPFGETGHHPAKRRRLDRLVPEQLLGQAGAGKRNLAATHVVQRTSQRIDVAADIGGARVPRLLGGDIVERADRGPVARDPILLGQDRSPAPSRPAWRFHHA